ncbi:MAG: aminoglycoside phosphotransferase family protein [Thermoleophilaceae bacterium]|nr:aminoglycoside phosphotransferase family protein [Thermoleophilaceae bacterium]
MSGDLAQQVIGAAGIDARVAATSMLGEGAKSVVSKLELENAEPLALKVFRSGSRAGREHAAYRLLGEHSSHVPRLLAAAAETPDFPFGYSLLTIAAGEPLSMNFGGLERVRLLAVYRGVGGFLASLHRTAGRGFSELSDERLDRDNAVFVARRVDRALVTFLTHGGSHRLAGRLESYFADASECLARSAAPVLCHGDLHPGNIFVTGDASTLSFAGVIDLEGAFTGDAVMDLVRVIHSCPLPGDDLTRAVLEGYGDKPAGFDALFDVYLVLFELELWNYYAVGGSRRPLRSIARRIRKRTRA